MTIFQHDQPQDMDSRIKQLWIEALRSGEYPQGTQRLFPSVNSYCCLGVLTMLYCEEHKIDWHRFADLPLLPQEVTEWAGCSSNPSAGKTLSLLNDLLFTFKEIADAIEVNQVR